jgi:hypothetical protein
VKHKTDLRVNDGFDVEKGSDVATKVSLLNELVAIRKRKGNKQ